MNLVILSIYILFRYNNVTVVIFFKSFCLLERYTEIHMDAVI